ncbi:MAG: hypothetical protein RI556_12665 [Hydrogenovibrio sp.]|uniref:hypothetical protein n=1 Tax=Hydrogenovibrio sp. TaxID=2065821 RepID=UPI00286FF4F5|nr:hypothetical protein [Hydrogenovibrio sp.]MDR9500022.1 hypothetical protein [Hydrogenovibrio sp.]
MGLEVVKGFIQGFFLALIMVVPFWVSFKKAGLSPWHALWLFIPFFGFLIALGVLALSDWKLEKLEHE